MRMDLTAEDIIDQLSEIDLSIGYIRSCDMNHLISIIKDAKVWREKSDAIADAEDCTEIKDSKTIVGHGMGSLDMEHDREIEGRNESEEGRPFQDFDGTCPFRTPSPTSGDPGVDYPGDLSLDELREFVHGHFENRPYVAYGVWVMLDIDASNDWKILYIDSKDEALHYINTKFNDSDYDHIEDFKGDCILLIDGSVVDFMEYIPYENTTETMKELRNGDEIGISSYSVSKLRNSEFNDNEFMRFLSRGVYVLWDRVCLESNDDYPEDWRIQFFGVETPRNIENALDALDKMYLDYSHSGMESFFDYTCLMINGTFKPLCLKIAIE